MSRLAGQYDLEDELNRAFCQYRCFRLIDNPIKHLIVTLWALVASLFIVLFMFLKGVFKSNDNKSIAKNIAVNVTSPTYLNKELLQKFTIVQADRPRGYLRKSDLSFILRVSVFFFKSPYFVLKCIENIATYRAINDRFKPDAIIVHLEFWFASSVLTKYCEELNIEHINVMHGEKLLWFRDSFFKFHRCYIWEQHYKDVFIKLYAEPEQFYVLRSDTKEALRGYSYEPSDNLPYRYFLQGSETIEKLQEINKQFKALGAEVIFRCHPRYTDPKRFDGYPEFKIELPGDVEFIQSMLTSSGIISKYSTVLYEAGLIGVPVIIDDWTNKEMAAQLRNREFIIFNRPHKLLSEFILQKSL